jgi:hypothetical protein
VSQRLCDGRVVGARQGAHHTCPLLRVPNIDLFTLVLLRATCHMFPRLAWRHVTIGGVCPRQACSHVLDGYGDRRGIRKPGECVQPWSMS